MMSKYFKELKILYTREKFLVLSSIAIMTVTFTILGFFLSLVMGFHTAIKTLESQAQITLFFKDEFSEAKILELKSNIENNEKILNVNYVSKEQAFKIFTDLNKDAPILLEAVTKDILPASLEIRARNLQALSGLAEEFKVTDGVEEVKFFRDVVDRFKYWANIIYVVGGVLVAVFLSLSYAIILATLRINISSKADEIEVMKLVGASDIYISRPFKMHGLGFGVISALLASFILTLLFVSIKFLGIFSVDSKFIIIPGIKVGIVAFLIILNFVILISGALVGYLGSLSAVKKYLKI
ncbi:hypothetical protein HYV31_00710 [candidate division WWE3 bacterium]|nr:hypothetical protein [candidate division WWE3 bacterium]